jgi:catechol 2,3-dioxygenase-like lactoylglutathione lyase family enzyme
MAYIDHVHIHASDPGKTIKFFEDFFGAQVTQEFENIGRRITVMALGDKSRLCILHVPPAAVDPRPEMATIDHIGIVVEDIEDLIYRLKKMGFSFLVDLTRSSNGNKIAFFLGPDNLHLEIFEPARPISAPG